MEIPPIQKSIPPVFEYEPVKRAFVHSESSIESKGYCSSCFDMIWAFLKKIFFCFARQEPDYMDLYENDRAEFLRYNAQVAETLLKNPQFGAIFKSWDSKRCAVFLIANQDKVPQIEALIKDEQGVDFDQVTKQLLDMMDTMPKKLALYYSFPFLHDSMVKALKPHREQVRGSYIWLAKQERTEKQKRMLQFLQIIVS